MIRTTFLCLAACMAHAAFASPPRLAVLTDIGGDPDDQQSMIRLMVYANEFDIELLLAVSVVSVVVVLVTQLISDIGYVYLNPRIRIS